MKKLYILLVAMISVSTIFAQDRGRNNYQKDNDRNDNKQWSNTQQDHNDRNNNQQWGQTQQKDNYQDRNYSTNNRNYNGQQRQFQEKDRRAAIDMVNRDYDQRINSYRNNRYMKPYERDRRIAEMQRERQQKINSFGKGVITGAIVGLIAGVLFSH